MTDELGQLRADMAKMQRRLEVLEKRRGGFDGKAFGTAIVREVKAYVAKAIDGHMRYRGIWQAAADYKRGDATTCDGALWTALSPSSGVKPGSGPAWQLCAKSHAK